MDLKKSVRTIKGFPVEGINFRDITTLLKDSDAFAQSIDQLAEVAKDFEFDVILGIEARGFILGAPLAYKLNKGFIPVRKTGKLPAATIKKSYGLEYGNDAVEIHEDAIFEGLKVLLVDDLLATGGTMRAVVDMVRSAGAKPVAAIFLIELSDLNGKDKIEDIPVKSIMKFTEDEE
ncbi:MAG: adenine phosphoribosyltransferase [Tissierellia bacterium]|nr:adenine phosphoribosyltransferase [Tissierellia bacterium]